jgi:hypothetical protein
VVISGCNTVRRNFEEISKALTRFKPSRRLHSTHHPRKRTFRERSACNCSCCQTVISCRTSGKGRGAVVGAFAQQRVKRAHTAPLGSSCSFSADPTYDPSEVVFERMSSIQYQLSAECCLRDFFQSFYEGPCAKLPDQGGPPRISGVTQYVITDLLQALSSCQVHTADDFMAMVSNYIHLLPAPLPPPSQYFSPAVAGQATGRASSKPMSSGFVFRSWI